MRLFRIPLGLLAVALVCSLLVIATGGFGPCGPASLTGLIFFFPALFLWPIGLIWLVVAFLRRLFGSQT